VYSVSSRSAEEADLLIFVRRLCSLIFSKAFSTVFNTISEGEVFNAYNKLVIIYILRLPDYTIQQLQQSCSSRIDILPLIDNPAGIVK
jgi:hypothetical protein